MNFSFDTAGLGNYGEFLREEMVFNFGNCIKNITEGKGIKGGTILNNNIKYCFRQVVLREIFDLFLFCIFFLEIKFIF